MSIMNTIEYLRTEGQGTTSGSATLPALDQGIMDRALLERALPYLRHIQFGQQKSIGRNKGMSLVFRRYESLAQATVPLVDGVTPPGTRLTKTDYIATLKQYGNWTVVTDNVDLFHINRVMVEASELMGENMGESFDTIVREILVAGTSVRRINADDVGTYAEHADRANVGGVLCKSAVDRTIRDLEANKAKTFMPAIPAGTKTSTSPVGEAYWWLIHPDNTPGFFLARGGWLGGIGVGSASGFIPVHNYAAHQGVMKGEVGAYRNVRFVTTTNLKIWLGSGIAIGTSAGMKNDGTLNDVYGTLVFGRDAYGVVKPDKALAGIITHRAGGSSDPLNQRNTVGWKGHITAVILKHEWMCRVECTAIA